MFFIKPDKKAVFCIVAVVFIVTKEYMVNDLQLIPLSGDTNRLISWLVILPLAIAGFIFAIQTIVKNLLKTTRRAGRFWNINLLLVLPMLFCSLYVLGLMLVTAYLMV